jgi:hypothetical protein
VFPLPEPQIFGSATRVMSLRDGRAKMSKSDPSDNSRINMTDDADMIMQKIRKAKTDPDALPSEMAGLADRPEASNLVGIYAALAECSTDDVLAEFGGRGFGDFKPRLAIWRWRNYRQLVLKCGGFLKTLPILTRFLLMVPNVPRPLRGQFLLRCVILLGF